MRGNQTLIRFSLLVIRYFPYATDITLLALFSSTIHDCSKEKTAVRPALFYCIGYFVLALLVHLDYRFFAIGVQNRRIRKIFPLNHKWSINVDILIATIGRSNRFFFPSLSFYRSDQTSDESHSCLSQVKLFFNKQRVDLHQKGLIRGAFSLSFFIIKQQIFIAFAHFLRFETDRRDSFEQIRNENIGFRVRLRYLLPDRRSLMEYFSDQNDVGDDANDGHSTD